MRRGSSSNTFLNSMDLSNTAGGQVKRGVKMSLALTTAVAMTMVSVAGLTEASAATKPVTLTMYSSGDVNVQDLWQNDLIPAFEKAHPEIQIKLVFSEHGNTDTATLAKLTASQKANQPAPFDIIDAGLVSQASQANELQKLNNKEVPLLGHIDKNLLKQNAWETMPYRGSSVVIAYNTAFVKTPPKTLGGLVNWIKENPGKFTYNTPDSGGSGSAFVQAMLRQYIPTSLDNTFASGYNTKFEHFWKKGFNAMKALSPDIYRKGFYPNGNDAVLQLLGSGAIYMAPVWSDMALSALAQNQLPPSVKLVQLTPPLNGGPADLGIPKNSKYLSQADTFLNWLLTPAEQTVIINKMNGFPGVEWKFLPKAVQSKFAAVASTYVNGFSSQFSSDMNSQWQSNVASN